MASVERGISSISKGLDLIEEEINWQKEALYNPTNKRSSRKLKKKLVDVHINMESSLQSTKKLYYKVVHNATSAAELYKEDPRSFGISEMTAVMVFLLKEFEVIYDLRVFIVFTANLLCPFTCHVAYWPLLEIRTTLEQQAE